MFKEIGEESLTILVLLGSIILIVLITFVVLLSYLFTTKKNKLIQEKQLMQSEHSQALLQTQLEIQEQTLKTISQEIHDNVGQVLSLAKLNLNTLDIEGGINKEQKIESSIQLVSKAINDLRDLSRSLNGDKIADLGLQDAIDNELKIIQNTGQFKTQLLVTGEPYKLLPQNEMVLFRIVQESLNNVVKHSRAKTIVVDMEYATQYLRLAITDDGAGFDALHLEAMDTGIGLNNMKNRASLIGALFSIKSAPDSGTSVMIELPQGVES
jgi:two-component system, NarL family, sensor kinase